jgi:hypothetical protein
MNDIIIIRQSGGLGRVDASVDAVSGLVTTGDPIVGGMQNGINYMLRSVADAEAIGITKLNDATTGQIIWYHIDDFFRIAPEGTFYLRVAALATSVVDLIDEIEVLSTAAEGKISQFAISYNGVVVAGSHAYLPLIPLLQTLATKFATEHKPAHMMLEGFGFSILGHSNLRALNCPDVSVVIAQTKSQFDIKPTACAIGLALGAVAKSAVTEHIGWVQKFNMLGGNVQEIYLNSQPIENTSVTNQGVLSDKGFIFLKKHIGLAGLYWNETSTCTLVTDDFAFIENVRTINKAIRIVRKTLLPDLNSPISINPTTGQIAAIVSAALQAKVGKAIVDEMETAGEISGFIFKIAPGQNILVTSELACELDIIPTGTARRIVTTIKFFNPFA